MNLRNLAVSTLITMMTVFVALANPIPVPLPAAMPLEQMHIAIEPNGKDLIAQFAGDFTFTYIPNGVNSMLFPVPPTPTLSPFTRTAMNSPGAGAHRFTRRYCRRYRLSQ